MFPRREFTAEDLNRTLLELELVPSASVVLRPVSQNQLRLLFGLMRILLLWFHRTLEFPQSFSAVPPLWKRGLVWVCLSPPPSVSAVGPACRRRGPVLWAGLVGGSGNASLPAAGGLEVPQLLPVCDPRPLCSSTKGVPPGAQHPQPAPVFLRQSQEVSHVTGSQRAGQEERKKM